MYGPLVVLYLFLGGCGAGVLLTASVWSLAFHWDPSRTREQTAVFRTLRNRCYVAGFVLACLAALCLLADLGRPERFVLLFLRPSFTSIIAFGTFMLAGMVLVAGLLAVANLCYVPRVTSRMKVVAEIACALLSTAVMTYTGVYLQSTKAVALWDTPLVPVLFVLSAVSAGIAVIVIAAALMRDAWHLEPWLFRLGGAHAAVLVLEACALALFVVAGLAGRGEAPASVALLLSDDLRAWFVGGACVAGIAVPLASEAACLALRRPHAIPLADVLCLFGGYALRYCLVAAGLH